MKEQSKAVMNWRIRTKRKLIEYKGGRCVKCGYDKIDYHRSFHFHHRDPSQKDFSISGKSWSFERLRVEADKCDLYCSRCHDEIHSDMDDLLISGEWQRKRLTRRPWNEKLCAHCGKPFKTKIDRQKYCNIACASGARNEKRRNGLKKPTKDQLKDLMESMSFSAIGRQFSVSDNAVRKWAKKYELI